jgi:hypothetical protein
VPGFLSSRPNWFPRPLSRKRMLSPLPLVPRGGHTCLQERGRGEPIRTKGQSLWYSIGIIKSLHGWVRASHSVAPPSPPPPEGLYRDADLCLPSSIPASRSGPSLTLGPWGLHGLAAEANHTPSHGLQIVHKDDSGPLLPSVLHINKLCSVQERSFHNGLASIL